MAEGVPGALGGRVLNVGLVLAVVAWIISLFGLSSATEASISQASADVGWWMMLAGSSVVCVFLLLVWKMWRIAAA